MPWQRWQHCWSVRYWPYHSSCILRTAEVIYKMRYRISSLYVMTSDASWLTITFRSMDTKESPSLHCTAPSTWLMDLLLIICTVFFWVSRKCYLNFSSIKLIEVMLIIIYDIPTKVWHCGCFGVAKIECDKSFMQLDTCNDCLLNGVHVPDIIQRKPQKIDDLGHWKGEQYGIL